jgi:hypothetical protein
MNKPYMPHKNEATFKLVMVLTQNVPKSPWVEGLFLDGSDVERLFDHEGANLSMD